LLIDEAVRRAVPEEFIVRGDDLDVLEPKGRPNGSQADLAPEVIVVISCDVHDLVLAVVECTVDVVSANADVSPIPFIVDKSAIITSQVTFLPILIGRDSSILLFSLARGNFEV
jgi:hypothetical protein